MKKYISIVLILLHLFPVFSQNTKNIQVNLIKKEVIKTNNFSDINLLLTSENIFINEYNGKDILIEIYSNNLKKAPAYKIEKNTLTISNNKKLNKGENCSIYIYIPSSNNLQNLSITNKDGNISINKISIAESISVSSKSTKLVIKETKSSFFKINIQDGNLFFVNNSFDFFDIFSNTATNFIQLNTNPLGLSTIQTDSGIINLSLLSSLNWNIETKTKTGKIKNEITGLNDYNISKILLESESGNISVVKLN